jgi:hypothetical protein
MFKKVTPPASRGLAVWTVAIALQIVGLGITYTGVADEASGSNLTPVTVEAIAQPTSTRSIRLSSLSSIDPVGGITAVKPHFPKAKPIRLACFEHGHSCHRRAECCSWMCYGGTCTAIAR